MLISKTPFRLSFFGGGTDYPEYFNEHGGAVLATSINKYCWVGGDNGKMWSHSDLPMRSGMGTSSAFTVGSLKTITNKSNKEIAELATIWERDKLDGHVGYQDQYLCAVGGFHRLRFFGSGIVDEELDYGWLEPYLMLFDTGQYRRAGDVVAPQLARVDENMDALHALKKMALDDYTDYKSFGVALGVAWQLKKSLADSVSTKAIDNIWSTALEAGAKGGKLLGAGGGGFIVFVVHPDKHSDVREALKLKQIEFRFENEGSQIVYDSNKS
ncbi:hypothetical protein LCGC14_0385290 [marine sediment metagenome]|uniref:Uncharacterized protein n=1 Tax=marine sediment metagenome TaxID=412755 RepID=A0A0F9TJE8_9ZZZZ